MVKENKFNVIVCASGGGGNFQALIDSRVDLGIEITLLIVNCKCGAIVRAKKAEIPHVLLDSSRGNEKMFEEFLRLMPVNVDLIVLAGFMPILPAYICERWDGKIINTHPSLLPKYGGKGMYGVKVQEAVMGAGDEWAGCTVHFVSAGIDEGKIILQKAIQVERQETPWELGGRVFKEENKLIVNAVRLIKQNRNNDFGLNNGNKMD